MGPVDLGVSDTGAPIGLVDSKGASGTGISLVDTGGGSGAPLKDDTALAADLGLSGSVGGVPSPGRSAGRSGINVFGDESEAADPMAQTNISASVQDQVNLEGVGSGSGLLDLTRESDDTSLGAELLDEIAPGAASRGAAPGDTGAGGTGVAPAIPAGRARGVAGPIMMEAADPMAPAFGGAALAAAIMIVIAGIALMSAIMGTRPGLLGFLESPQAFLMTLGIGAGAALVFFIIGLVIGRR